jgi:DNA-directed RNA polymerase subunit RPC12/RpoP
MSEEVKIVCSRCGGKFKVSMNNRRGYHCPHCGRYISVNADGSSSSNAQKNWCDDESCPDNSGDGSNRCLSAIPCK